MAEDEKKTNQEEQEPSEVDKLRSTYDKKIAGLTKGRADDRQELAAVNLELAQSQARLKSSQVSVDSDADPEELAKQVKKISEDKATLEATFEAYKSQAWPFVIKGSAVEKILTDEQKERLGQLEDQLRGAKNTGEFAAILDRVEGELSKSALEKENAELKAKLEEKEPGKKKPEVDGGKTAGRRDVISEMRGLNPNDPEHRREWANRRQEFRDKANIGR